MSQKKEGMREEIGLIFFSSFHTYDSSGRFNHGIDYFNATDDYFIPLKNYKKYSNPIELFRSDNLKKGFILFSYPQRNKIIKRAAEYIDISDSTSCYFTPTFKLLAVRIKYKVLSNSEATFCNGNNTIIFSNNRHIKFSYHSWSNKIIDIKIL